MRISEVMNEPVACLPSDGATRAAIIMRDENTGIVPVVASFEDRKLVGVVTDRDLCIDIVAAGRDPNDVKVQDCMTSEVVTCRPEEDLKRAAELMGDNQIRRIVITDDNSHLKGVVSLADISWDRQLGESKTAETLEKISSPSSEASKPRARSH
jgi:CBS domain-containing protein